MKTFICKTCQKASPKRRDSSNKYCSRKCYYESIGSTNYKFSASICPQCKEEFHVPPFRFKVAKIVCCSKTCAGKWNSKNRIGKEAPNWKRGFYVHKLGYKRLLVNNKVIMEHRIIMEKHLNRKLKEFPEEVVHHINGITDDNRIENLKVMSGSVHSSFHRKLKLNKS